MGAVLVILIRSIERYDDYFFYGAGGLRCFVYWLVD